MPWRLLAEDRAMLLDLDSGDYYELRGAAPYIWAFLDGRTDLEDIAQSVANAYQINEKTALNDLNGFVQTLDSNGLLSDSQHAPDNDDLSADVNDSSRTAPYEAPTVQSKGNLKYLGQLD